MSERLVIFCTSVRPDPYFNVVAHAVSFQGIRDFSLVAVGDDFATEMQQKAASVADDLSRFVEELRLGGYWTRDQSDGSERIEPLPDPAPFVDAVNDLDWGSLSIGRAYVREEDLQALLAKEAGLGSAFDVTSCKNSVVAAATAWLVSRGGSPIYTFDLRRTPTYGFEDLLPAMAPSDYEYRDLSRSALLVDATRKVNSLSLRRKQLLWIAILAAVVVGFVSLRFSETVAFSVLTALASFASITSGMALLVRSE